MLASTAADLTGIVAEVPDVARERYGRPVERYREDDYPNIAKWGCLVAAAGVRRRCRKQRMMAVTLTWSQKGVNRCGLLNALK